MTIDRGRARLGVLVPFTNTNLEPDMMKLAPPGVSVHFARLGGYDVDEIPDDTQMAGLGSADLTEPLALIQGARPHVVLYGCTSATLTHGAAFDRSLADRISAQSGAASLTAAGALVHGIKAIGAARIGFASPYVSAINDMAIEFLESEGIETVGSACIAETLGNYGQGELTPDEVYELACRADTTRAEAIVLSCTDMRSVETVDRLESALGKPVICSNQAMMHQALEVLELTPTAPCGQLFKRLAA